MLIVNVIIMEVDNIDPNTKIPEPVLNIAKANIKGITLYESLEPVLSRPF